MISGAIAFAIVAFVIIFSVAAVLTFRLFLSIEKDMKQSRERFNELRRRR